MSSTSDDEISASQLELGGPASALSDINWNMDDVPVQQQNPFSLSEEEMSQLDAVLSSEEGKKILQQTYTPEDLPAEVDILPDDTPHDFDLYDGGSEHILEGGFEELGGLSFGDHIYCAGTRERPVRSACSDEIKGKNKETEDKVVAKKHKEPPRRSRRITDKEQREEAERIRQENLKEERKALEAMKGEADDSVEVNDRKKYPQRNHKKRIELGKGKRGGRAKRRGLTCANSQKMHSPTQDESSQSPERITTQPTSPSLNTKCKQAASSSSSSTDDEDDLPLFRLKTNKPKVVLTREPILSNLAETLDSATLNKKEKLKVEESEAAETSGSDSKLVRKSTRERKPNAKYLEFQKTKTKKLKKRKEADLDSCDSDIQTPKKNNVKEDEPLIPLKTKNQVKKDKKEDVQKDNKEDKEGAQKDNKENIEVSEAEGTAEKNDSDSDFGSEDDPDRLWCICRQPHSNRFMICCDHCDDWFHGTCVGVSEKRGQEIQKSDEDWKCPPCIAKIENVDRNNRSDEKCNKEEMADSEDDGLVIQEHEEHTSETEGESNQDQAKISSTVDVSEDKQETPVEIEMEEIKHSEKLDDFDTPKEKVEEKEFRGKNKHDISEKPKKKKRFKVFKNVSKETYVAIRDRCIVTNCNKARMLNAVYCSEDCIAKHAKESVRLLAEEKQKQMGSSREASKPDPSERVIVFQRSTGKILTGPTAPTVRTLQMWLENHPSFEVLRSSQKQETYNKKEKVDLKKETDLPKKDLVETKRENKEKQAEIMRKVMKDRGQTEPVKKEKKVDKKSSQSSHSSQEPVRSHVRTVLREFLRKRAKDADDILLADHEIKALALAIEEELYKHYRGCSPRYKNKYKCLCANIKDRKNKGLFRKILKGLIRPHDLVRMPAELLSSKKVAEWKSSEKDKVKETKPPVDILSSIIVDTTSKHDRHLFDLNCKICTGSQKSEEKETSTPKPKAKAVSLKEYSSRKKSKIASPSSTASTDTSLTESEPMNVVTFELDSQPDQSELNPVSNCAANTRPKESPVKTTESVPTERTIRYVPLSELGSSTGDSDLAKYAPWKVGTSPSDDMGPVTSAYDSPWNSVSSKNLHEKIAEKKEVKKIPEKKEVKKTDTKQQPVIPLNEAVSKRKDKGTRPYLWKGTIDMPDVSRHQCKALPVSGNTENLQEDLGTDFTIVGRINPNVVWDYLNTLKAKCAETREITVIRFQIATDADKIGYSALFSYLNSRNRCGVVGGTSRRIKDMYLVPLASNSKVPPALMPFNGPGLAVNRPNCLLGIVTRQKVKKPKYMPSYPAQPESPTATQDTRTEYKPLPIDSQGSNQTAEEYNPASVDYDEEVKFPDNAEESPYSPEDSPEETETPYEPGDDITKDLTGETATMSEAEPRMKTVGKVTEQIAQSTNPQMTAAMVATLAVTGKLKDQQKLLLELTQKVEEQKRLLTKKAEKATKALGKSWGPGHYPRSATTVAEGSSFVTVSSAIKQAPLPVPPPVSSVYSLPSILDLEEELIPGDLEKLTVNSQPGNVSGELVDEVKSFQVYPLPDPIEAPDESIMKRDTESDNTNNLLAMPLKENGDSSLGDAVSIPNLARKRLESKVLKQQEITKEKTDIKVVEDKAKENFSETSGIDTHNDTSNESTPAMQSILYSAINKKPESPLQSDDEEDDVAGLAAILKKIPVKKSMIEVEIPGLGTAEEVPPDSLYIAEMPSEEPVGDIDERRRKITKKENVTETHGDVDERQQAQSNEVTLHGPFATAKDPSELSETKSSIQNTSFYKQPLLPHQFPLPPPPPQLFTHFPVPSPPPVPFPDRSRGVMIPQQFDPSQTAVHNQPPPFQQPPMGMPNPRYNFAVPPDRSVHIQQKPDGNAATYGTFHPASMPDVPLRNQSDTNTPAETTKQSQELVSTDSASRFEKSASCNRKFDDVEKNSSRSRSKKQRSESPDRSSPRKKKRSRSPRSRQNRDQARDQYGDDFRDQSGDKPKINLDKLRDPDQLKVRSGDHPRELDKSTRRFRDSSADHRRSTHRSRSRDRSRDRKARRERRERSPNRRFDSRKHKSSTRDGIRDKSRSPNYRSRSPTRNLSLKESPKRKHSPRATKDTESEPDKSQTSKSGDTREVKSKWKPLSVKSDEVLKEPKLSNTKNVLEMTNASLTGNIINVDEKTTEVISNTGAKVTGKANIQLSLANITLPSKPDTNLDECAAESSMKSMKDASSSEKSKDVKYGKDPHLEKVDKPTVPKKPMLQSKDDATPDIATLASTNTDTPEVSIKDTDQRNRVFQVEKSLNSNKDNREFPEQKSVSEVRDTDHRIIPDDKIIIRPEVSRQETPAKKGDVDHRFSHGDKDEKPLNDVDQRKHAKDEHIFKKKKNERISRFSSADVDQRKVDYISPRNTKVNQFSTGGEKDTDHRRLDDYCEPSTNVVSDNVLRTPSLQPVSEQISKSSDRPKYVDQRITLPATTETLSGEDVDLRWSGDQTKNIVDMNRGMNFSSNPELSRPQDQFKDQDDRHVQFQGGRDPITFQQSHWQDHDCGHTSLRGWQDKDERFVERDDIRALEGGQVWNKYECEDRDIDMRSSLEEPRKGDREFSDMGREQPSFRGHERRPPRGSRGNWRGEHRHHIDRGRGRGNRGGRYGRDDRGWDNPGYGDYWDENRQSRNNTQMGDFEVHYDDRNFRHHRDSTQGNMNIYRGRGRGWSGAQERRAPDMPRGRRY